MSTITFPNSLHVTENLSCRTLTVPAGAVDNAAIKALAAIDSSKVIHRHALRYAQEGGTDVVAETMPLHLFQFDAEILSIEAAPIVAPVGGDLQYTVDLQRGSPGVAFASILTTPIVIDGASADRTAKVGVLADTEGVDGQILQLVITPSGSTGAQGQGLIVRVSIAESPN